MVSDGELAGRVERAVFVHRELMDRLWQSLDAPAAPPPAPSPAAAVDWVAGDAEVRGLLKLALDNCRDGVLVLHSTVADSPELVDFLDGYPASGHRVAIRVLCRHGCRADFADRTRALRLVDGGGQVRTVAQLPQSAVIFDRGLAVLLGAGEDGQPAAQRVRDRNLVRCLVGLFEQLWDGGTPFTAEQSGYEPVAEDLRYTLARLMAEGLTDEVIARRLGISVRTCRRHVAALLRSLDSISRFQAGVQAAGWLRTGGVPR
jgi:Homeodomain-like domain